jgi:hypothetical protein
MVFIAVGQKVIERWVRHGKGGLSLVYLLQTLVGFVLQRERI